MSESTEPNLEDDLFTLTNHEYSKLKLKYFESNSNPHMSDELGFELNTFGLMHHYNNDDFLNLFTITDRKKFMYARIKYEF